MALIIGIRVLVGAAVVVVSRVFEVVMFVVKSSETCDINIVEAKVVVAISNVCRADFVVIFMKGCRCRCVLKPISDSLRARKRVQFMQRLP